ncbi:MAG: hypothetical protein KF794_11385 [Xanthobacteraceae bacterium]|nr:hypothetical protein [Xanthobacteraceae bacterium]QYK44373.1 MAG: hypothetical protein KF794_11385 [Xanthobacteraceae bacterium]
MRIFLAALTLLAFSLTGEAKAQRVVLEIAPQVTRSEPEFAAFLRRTLPVEINRAIAGKYTGTLRVRIVDARLMRGPSFGFVDSTDYLEGYVLVPRRDPVPIRLTLPFDRSAFSLTPPGENVRVYNLVRTFAQWVAKYI